MNFDNEQKTKIATLDEAGRKAIEPLRRDNQQRQQTWRETRWASICPAIYASNNLSRFPPKQWATAQAWRFGADGLLLVGPSGCCKTRIAYEFLKREFFAGRSVEALSSTQFSHEVGTRFYDGSGSAWIEKLNHADICFIDDIGKGKLTERVALELFGMIEYRTSRGKPLIITSNAGSSELTRMLAGDIAEPLIRRLVEFCHVIRFAEPENTPADSRD